MAADIGVLIVDDSSIVRRALKAQLDQQSGIKVLGTAPDPYIARDKILHLKPDVITLDIEMPRMDGLTFLRKLMKYHPVPTIIVSSLTQKGCDTAIACLEAGAVEVLAKPDASYSVGDLAGQLAEIIRSAPSIKHLTPLGEVVDKSVIRPATRAMLETTHKVVALGASTGGTEALKSVLTRLPKQCPGTVIVQHMPAGFTRSFAERLNDLSEIEVYEAKNGDAITPGKALLAPGDHHMQIARDGARYIVKISEGPRVCRHRPSVEVLFESAATYVGSNAIGIIMTGMGNDGATGLLSMRKAGALTIAQDEASCIVYGMPRAAAECDAAQVISSLNKIPNDIMKFAEGTLKASTLKAA